MMPFTVGASLLAMDVNDNACLLVKRGALESIASKLAPTLVDRIRLGEPGLCCKE
ncbi:hypothetical protein PS838_01326 [Pseudomonas fluorescens]|jgi:hypothetical protein|nr:hypothetical protein PS838_01326 [Pseudomonas fluorescens]